MVLGQTCQLPTFQETKEFIQRKQHFCVIFQDGESFPGEPEEKDIQVQGAVCVKSGSHLKARKLSLPLNCIGTHSLTSVTMNNDKRVDQVLGGIIYVTFIEHYHTVC